MAETVVNLTWYSHNMESDLEHQGGLDNVVIDKSNVDEGSYVGRYDGNRFYVRWAYKASLILSMKQFSQKLVDAFSKVLGYKPFCRYNCDGSVIVEWDKIYPAAAFESLREEKGITNIVRL